MIPLSSQDKRHLDAAEGWCGLKSFLEANEELEKITPQARAHPRVLEIRWQIYASLKKWDGALEVARALTKFDPANVNYATNLGISFASLNRHAEAYDAMFKATSGTPQAPHLYYHMARTCCKLKRIEDAQLWLTLAFDTGGKEYKLKALDDTDLEPLWWSVEKM